MTNGEEALFSAGQNEPSKAPRALRIIVADDDRDTVLTLMMVLRHEGHEVWGLHRAKDVVRGIRDFDPDVVILDIAMPDMSGWQVAEEICKTYGNGRPLLIAISGVFTKTPDRILAQLVGFDHHLPKPYMPSDVLRLIAPLRYPSDSSQK